ncbi:TetR/AcrR family transcriptional regulator [Nocardiopsis lambiniae]|uniref:TetR family transcriptional regulator n=1 Tax=Nocardiopsis lambiniae TaxID=3075539 RepID=A0ABU2MF07_9ACTN|nr:TetR family transcriptional regulator [Nocardiopsis sp. DSM 44743]MDT0331275.1 TetR family transcriptional regulator [Nocardiopsis sp. DSM 44743]
MGSTDSTDLTARARIRDAAVVCFGDHGFKVTVRTIAEKAEVSPGLVIHHFGSKAGLRKACDDHVFAIIHEAKMESVTSPDPMRSFRHLSHLEDFAPLMAYIIRSLQEGGPLGLSLHERMVRDVEEYLAAGEEAGNIRPSRDPRKRARFLANMISGSLLMALAERPGEERVDFSRFLQEWTEEYMLPALELYCEGLFTDRKMLDAYLMYVSDPPEGSR